MILDFRWAFCDRRWINLVEAELFLGNGGEQENGPNPWSHLHPRSDTKFYSPFFRRAQKLLEEQRMVDDKSSTEARREGCCSERSRARVTGKRDRSEGDPAVKESREGGSVEQCQGKTGQQQEKGEGWRNLIPISLSANAKRDRELDGHLFSRTSLLPSSLSITVTLRVPLSTILFAIHPIPSFFLLIVLVRSSLVHTATDSITSSLGGYISKRGRWRIAEVKYT
ncbi:hypothetical protein BT69DRAFT_1306337 [Atractiella rhizophila]|nr:hypothetical protein BT69DRAFT_1306337 [Atractiella rhizophila]